MITVVLLAGMRLLSQGLLLPVVEAEGDMTKIVGKTNLAATLNLADAIEEFQTGDLPQKTILERPLQKKQQLDPGLN